MQEKQTRQSLRAAELIGKYLRGSITASEEAELEKWVGATEGSSQFMREVTDAQLLQEGTEAFGQSNTDEKWEQLLDRIIEKEKTGTKRIRRVTWLHAAAVLLIAIGCWAVIVITMRDKDEPELLSGKYGNDLPPGSKKAELVLSNGHTVILQAGNDSSFTEADSDVKRTAGELWYQQEASDDENLAWNLLRTPRGGEYMVTLADGTKVWLNAASSLHYPVKFTGNTRRVELTGEGYFEVAKNKDKPFYVTANRMEIQAVGTAFNVNSYSNADSMTITTLEEGKIKVTTKHKTVSAEPGQQVRADLATTDVGEGNVEMATAWKNGLFLFNNTPLQEVAQQLSQWYDVQVVYDKNFKLPRFFTGEIKRNLPVSRLLEMLEMTGIAKFKIEKNIITVLPYNR